MRFSLPGRLSNAPTIFISYRRDDTSGYAGRLHDALRDVLGDEKVRMDVDDFAAGGEFAVEAKEMVARSDVLLALIGKRWAEGPNATRLADPADLLRHEIETALENGVRVIPVLVDGAKLPDAASLPESLHPLLQRNAFELSERRWDYDVTELVKTLRGTPLSARAADRAAGGIKGRGARPWGLAAIAAVIVAVVIAGTLYLKRRDDVAPPATGSTALPPVARRNDGSVFSIDHDRFFQAYTREFGALQPEARPVLDGLLSMVDVDTGLVELRWAAYILATIKFESGNTWLPLEERDKGRGRRYADTVVLTDPEGRRYRNAYYGRGYVQITWEHNYRTMGEILKNRLRYEPDLALEPSVSYQILSASMRRGMFTGRRLGQYINDTTCDYVNARRIVNGLDRAQRIAADAVRMEKILRESTPPPQPQYTAVTPLYVRSAPGMSQPVIGNPIPAGSVVRERDKQNEWMRVTVSSTGVTGWVPGSFLRPAAAAQAGPPCSSGEETTT